MRGGLFSEYFLVDGVRDMPGWPGIDAAGLEAARDRIKRLLDDFGQRHRPNERETEGDLIEPMLQLLGWHDLLWQQRANERGRHDVPDFLLFDTADAKAAATRAEGAAKRHALGATIVEGKAWGIALDRAEPGAAGAPATQLLRYLGTVEVQSEGRIRFGLLTDGRVWRVYDQKARSRLDGYLEIDLAEAIGAVVPADAATGADQSRPDHLLRLFLWLFGRDAFARDPAGRNRLDRAVEASRGFEARVTKALAATVFERVFPDLANALAAADPDRPDQLTPAYWAELREAALTWLYRLLFVLYAEDRDLLPTRTRNGVRPIREAAAAALDGEQPLSSFPEMDGDLRRLWKRVDIGDKGLRIPAYNGGLFRAARSPLLERSLIPDDRFAPLLDALSREHGSRERGRLINYRDLDVQHLGSVYERLLEYELADEDGHVVARPQAFARKTSGSYYTPDDLVMLVIRRTVGPLLEEKRQAFATATADRERRDQDPSYRLPWLQTHDPAAAFLTLRIVDPAMGSGHFLVNLVDYLADQTMLATDEAAALVPGYRSPLLDRLEAIRAGIKAQAAANGWAVRDEQLENDKLVRRIILKRVIHGVDKNPMAVELAKLSLWLHTFTVGAPLSFLDHHLRCGDSLFGEWLHAAITRLEGGGLLKRDMVTRAEQQIQGFANVEDRTDADIAEVHESAREFAEAREGIKPLERYLDLLQGYRWIEGSAQDALKQAKKLEREEVRATDPAEALRLNRAAWMLKRKGRALDVLLQDELGPADSVLDKAYGRLGDPEPVKPGDDPALAPLVKAAHIAATANFLHWELAFPTVWRHWLSPSNRAGGFDAVIGNPPWDRLKMQEVEWFAARRREIAYATRAADRARLIRELKGADAELAGQYEQASELAGLAGRMANLKADAGGQFPLLGGGDTNLYSLFVERAGALVRPGGVVGLLVPSGISGDLGASAWFRSVSTTGRLGALLDYANKPSPNGRTFFEDVDSRFKFSAIVFGGPQRRFDAAQCGFFLSTTNDAALAEATFTLAPADFAAVNPNTGTAPVFRTARDAALTTAIYARLPVLVRHAANRATRPDMPWPVRYTTMFHMTNDSHLFRTRAELEADGWYAKLGVEGLSKGKARAVPLYEGKMVQAYDHRAASVIVNSENLHRPGQPEAATKAQHMDPAWSPQPQFWVEASSLPEENSRGWVLGYKEITAPTNARTMIAAAFPAVAFGNKVPLLTLPADVTSADAALLLGNLNSIVFDFVTRQKLQGQTLNLFIVEQLPVIPPAAYDRRFGHLTAREIVAREVLALTYTAHDMAPFARDMGYVEADGEHTPVTPASTPATPALSRSPASSSADAPGEGRTRVKPPFRWDDADRRQRRARLDALYFHLYGIGREDADYILSTFPIVRRQDEAAFAGRYVTRDLILAHMAALDAGDPDAVIALR